MDRIRFKDLSVPLKILVVCGYGWLLWLLTVFIAGAIYAL
jgi:hypothetical protein